MNALHPTDLTLGAEHCWRALDHREAGVPYDRSVFAQGIAAHAVLEGIGLNPGSDADEVADTVAARLAGRGRAFDGVPEPPLPVEAVLEGVKLGVRWHARNPVPPGARYELGLAVDAQWRPVPYESSDAAFRVILDVVERVEEEDEESVVTVCVVRDYKSSWRDRQESLDTLQRHAQAVVVHASGLTDGCDVLRMEVANLRVGETYDRDLVLADSEPLFEEWQRDLTRAREAGSQRNPDGMRPASPGPRCVGCPYVLPCDARKALAGGEILASEPAALARRFAVLRAEAAGIESLLRAALDRDEAIDVDGMLVGYVPRAKREPVGDAYAALWERWSADGKREARGLLKALGLSVTAIERAAKVLFGTGRAVAAERRAWIAEVTTTRRTAQFGIAKRHSGAEEDEDHAEE